MVAAALLHHEGINTTGARRADSSLYMPNLLLTSHRIVAASGSGLGGKLWHRLFVGLELCISARPVGRSVLPDVRYQRRG